jgi:hypothetical protein
MDLFRRALFRKKNILKGKKTVCSTVSGLKMVNFAFFGHEV